MPLSSTPSRLCVGERQVLDVAFDEFDAGIFAAAERDQLGADVEADAV